MEKSDYIILFITVNFLNSEYIREVELKFALEKDQRIIPIIIDYCTWNFKEKPKDIQAMNKDIPLTSFTPISMGWEEVIQSLKAILEK